MSADTTPYVDIAQAATMLGCSRSTAARAAKSARAGVFVAGPSGLRLVAIDRRELARLRPFIHETPGNPNMIAAGRASRLRKRR